MKRMCFQSKSSKALCGDICVPGDKSISHRALILGSIALGQTTVRNFLEGDDCLATLNAMRAMGVEIVKTDPETLVIQGVGKYGLQKPDAPLDCANSGTSMRLLAGLLAAQSFDSFLVGDDSLSRRPMDRVSHPLNQMGAAVMTHEGKAPIHIQGGKCLSGIAYEMPFASAQIKSSLLLAGMYALGETRIVEPLHTRDHTERLLSAMSYPLKKLGHCISINPDGECLGLDIQVPGDLSSAAFFIVAATLIEGSALTIRDVGINPARTGILEILNRMGADITLSNKRLFCEEPVADIHVRSAPLEGVDIPASLVPCAIDEFPAIFIAAACAQGQTRLCGASELRVKESDRIGAMATGLGLLGIETQTFADGLMIQGGQLSGGCVQSGGDHRIVMAFAVAGALASAPVKIMDCESVGVSFPDFTETAQKAGLNVEIIQGKII